jgi:hypothetical protein
MKYLLTGLLLLSWGLAQTDFSGVYTTPGRAGEVVLTLTQNEYGEITGTIAGNSVSYNLYGYLEETGAFGTLESDEFASFTLSEDSASAGEITFTLSESSGEQSFTFTRQGDAPTIIETEETGTAETEEVPVLPEGSDNFSVGLFTNTESTRGLQVDAVNNGEYTGSLIIDGFQYPFTATGDDAQMSGNYVVGGDALVPFVVIKDGDTVRLEFPDNPESNAELTKAF